MQPLSDLPTSHLFGAGCTEQGGGGDKEMMQPPSNLPTSHLFGAGRAQGRHRQGARGSGESKATAVCGAPGALRPHSATKDMACM